MYVHVMYHVYYNSVNPIFIGYLTEQGYKYKKRKLMDELQSVESVANSKIPVDDTAVSELSSSSALQGSSIASKLCNESSIHSTLSKLFKPSKQGKTKGKGKLGSTIVMKKDDGKAKKSEKEVVATTHAPAKPAKIKTVTIVLLSPDCCTSIPKDRKKLRTEKRLNFCTFSSDDSVSEVNTKIKAAFPPELMDGQSLVYLKATQTGDLFDIASGKSNADQFMGDGKTILDLAGCGSLYMTTQPIVKRRMSTDPVTVIVQPIINQQPVVRVAPITSQISKGLLF